MISDQAQLGYLALQNIVDAMKELAVEEKQEPVKEKKNGKKNQPKLIEQKVSKQIKKGVFQVFDQMSKTHLNSRLWLNARLLFIQFDCLEQLVLCNCDCFFHNYKYYE